MKDQNPWEVGGDNELHCRYCFRTWRPDKFKEKNRPDLYHGSKCPILK